MADTAQHFSERIRALSPRDRTAVRRLGSVLFSQYGDYGPALDAWLRQPGVQGYVAEIEAAQTIGFVLIATQMPQLHRGHSYVLGIGVERGWQGRGLGRRLLTAAIDNLEQDRHGIEIHRLQLTVASDNLKALGLFRALGFRPVTGTTAAYSGGQQGIAMERPLGAHPSLGSLLTQPGTDPDLLR